ncbi:MAG: hypothetical protein WCY09_09080 [Candidatus Omnitrophota bacterium]
MSIKRTIIATVAALALVAAIAPVQATAATVEELTAQLTALQAQLTALQGTSTTTSTGSTYTACAGVTFSRYLTVGSTGNDVKCMQQIMNGTGYTIATTGAGSAGNETTYFGSLTLAAVKKWQVAQGWVAADQIGPKSIALLNSIVAGSSTGTTGSTGGTTTPTGDGLQVKISSDSPDSGSIIAGQAQAELLKLKFTNKDSSSVKVTKIKLTRGGVSSDSDLDNVYLFNGATRITDAASVSSGIISFNDSTGLFTIGAGDSVEITVVVDVDSSADGTVYVKLVSEDSITTNASAISGDFPIKGDTQTIVAGGSLASAYFTNSGTSGHVNPAGSTLDPQSDYPVWYTNLVTNISSGNIEMSRLALREVGSIDYEDIQNFRLYIDGVQAGDTVENLDDNGYVTFDLSDDPAVMKSGTRAIKVLADIVNGSSRTFSFQLKTSADVTLTDSQYGVAIVPGSNTLGGSFTAMRSCYDSSADTWGCTVGTGAITISKLSSSPSGDVVNDATNQVLASWKLKSNGERVKVENLTAYVAFNDVDPTADPSPGTNDTITLRNAAFYADDVQIGSTFNLTSATTGTEVSLGSSLIIDPDETVTLELRADIHDNEGTNEVSATDTLQAYLVAGSGNGQGLSSSDSVNVPTSNIAGNQLTVATGSLTLSKYTAYTSQTTTAPQTAYKLAHFTLSGSTTEATTLTSIEVDLTTLATYTTNLYAKIGSYTTSTKANPTATNTWAINYTLAKGTTVDVIVYGDIDSTKTGTGAASVLVEGTTTGSATAVSTGGGSVLAGQTITFGSGSATATIDGATPEEAILAGNQDVAAAKFKFTASNDSYTITEAKLTISGNDASEVQYATLTDGTNSYTAAFDSASGHDYFNFTGMNVAVSANTSKVLTAKLMLSTPSTDGTTITTGKNVALTMSYMKALNSQGEVKTSSSGITLSSVTGNNLYVYKSIPTFTVGTVSGEATNLANGSQTTLYKFTVGADSKGDVALKQLKFYVTINDANVATVARLGTFKFFRGSTDLTTSTSGVTIQTTDGDDLESATSLSATGTVVVTFNTEETIPAGSTYTYYLKAAPVGFAWSSTYGGDSVSTYLQGDTSATSQASSLYYLVGKTTAGSETQIQYLTAAADIASAGSGTSYNVTWSDNSGSGTDANTSAVGHSYLASQSSADWFNGYKVLDLPLNAIGITCAQ